MKNMTQIKTSCSSLLVAILVLNAFVFSLPTTASAAPVTLFSDGFEYNNFTGSVWTQNPSNSNMWNTSQMFAHTGSRKAKVTGNTQGPNYIYTSTSTTGFQNISLTFWYNASSLESDDFVDAEWSTDGSTWNTLSTLQITDGSEISTWTQKSITLPTGADNMSQLYIRFKAVLDAGNDEVYVDDVAISGEQIPEIPVDPCTYQNEAIYSDDTMIVDDNTAFLTWTHPVWVSTTTAAKWIWSSVEVQNPTTDEYKTFKKTFTLAGNPSVDAMLSIATDNSYRVVVNGTEIASTTSEQNFNAFANITVPASALHMSQNTIEVSVHNFAMANAGPHDNPAGLIFTLYAPTKTCPNDEPYTPTPDTLQVKIYKFLDGVQATADLAQGYDFPMQATWSWTGNSGTGNYVLNEAGHGGSPAYAAFTSVMTAPAMYTTHEITSDVDSNSNVLPIGAECTAGKYRLKGYRVGDSFAGAEGAPITSVVPNYNSLTHDKYVIVENETCPMPEQVSTVKICKWDNKENPLKDWTLYMYKGSKIEHLSVNTNNWNGVNTASVLDQNKSYFAIASSTWANQGGANMVDPEYSTTDNWVANIMDGYTGYGTGILELQIQNTDGNWGPYASSTHTYAQMFTPNSTGNVNFRVYDGTDGNQNQSWFNDNSGILGVDIYEGVAGVTGEDGCVTFQNVPYGSYQIGEIMKPDWQSYSGLDSVVIDSPTEEFVVVNKEVVPEPVNEDPLVCEDGYELNEGGTECILVDDSSDDEGDGGGAPMMVAAQTENSINQSGSRRHGGGSSGGEVLGASTGPACELYLTTYIKPNAKNNPEEVTKLQEFLNKYMGANLPTSGFYGPMTQGSVKKFQEMFASQILDPWKAVGLSGGEGTGNVYKTTQRWINIMVCPELILDLPIPPLP